MANANENPPVIGDAKPNANQKQNATGAAQNTNSNENKTESAHQNTTQTVAQPAESVSTPQEIAASNESLQAALAQVDTDPVAARESLTRILDNSATTATDRLGAYEAINKVNAVLTFSERVLANDPFSKQYTVQEGDSLSNIRKSLHLDCEWRFLQRINHLATERSIRVGQVLKLQLARFMAKFINVNSVSTFSKAMALAASWLPAIQFHLGNSTALPLAHSPFVRAAS